MKKIYLLSFLFVSLFGNSQFNPNAPWNVNVHKEQLNNFNKEVERATEYWKNQDPNKKGSGHKPYKRWENNFANHLNSDGTIFTPQQLWKAWEEKNKAKQNRTNSALALPPSNWEPIGPRQNALDNTRARGRVNIIEVHPTNPNIIYMGTPAGGLWKTINGGVNWLPLTDELPQIGVSGIAIDHTNPDVIYIATGDKDAGDTYSIGVMKSTNGGATWSTTGLTFSGTGTRAGDLIMHPTNNLILLCATSNGLFRTIDGGTSWTVEQTGNFAQGTIRFKPNNPAVVYATTYTAFYRSTNTGDTFTSITSGFGVGAAANTGRRILDVSAANPEYVYVLSSTTTNGYKGIYRSTNGGTSFTKIDNGTNVFEADQSWYDLAFCASQSNANAIFTGCLNVWKSANGGATATKLSDWSVKNATFTHADIHFLKEIGGKLFCGSDGGIFVSTNNGLSFTEINGDAQTNQFYRISVAKESSLRVSGGTQDNGGWAFNNNLWYGYHAGDGMDSGVSPVNSNIVYGFSQFGGVLNISNSGGTSTTSQVTPPTSEPQGNWIVPLKINSVGDVYAGFSKLFKLDNCTGAWVQQNTVATGGGNIDYIEIDPTNDNIIYVINENVVYKSINGGTTFSTLYSAGQVISSIEVNNSNNSIIYLTEAGTDGLVMKSIDGGITFNQIATGLPNVPKDIIVHQGRNTINPLYVGTEIGVYYTDDSMTTWQPFDTNLPNTPIRDLEINLEDGKLIAGTYGRGVWQTNIPVQIPLTDIKLVSINNPTTGVGCNGEINPVIEIKNGGSSPVTSVAVNYTIDGSPFVYNWSGNIASNQNQLINLPTSTTTRGAHTLSFNITTVGDAYIDNNLSSTSFYSNDSGTIATVNTFTNSTDELIVIQDGCSGWTRGNRTIDALQTSGNTAYLTNLSGNYADGVRSYLVSQCYNLSNVASPQISFKMAYDLEENWDVAYVEYSTNFGQNWSVLGSLGTGWYNSDRTSATSGTDCFECVGAQWTGTNTTFNTYSYGLTSLATETNVIFRIVFISDASVNQLGVKIDDFVINGVLSNQSFEANQVAVFPNPSNGIFNIAFGNLNPNKIEVYDISGKLILQKNNLEVTNNQTNINLSTTSDGVYFVKISTENNTITKRIIKN